MKLFAPVMAVCALFAAGSAIACPVAPGVVCDGDEEISLAALAKRLGRGDIVILGERHDNPAHHELQAKLIVALAPGGLAFEMVPQAKEDAANEARATSGDLAAALDWAHSGWPDWEMYAPLFAAAPDARIAGGGVGKDALRRSVMEGAAAVMGPESARYGLAERLPEPVIEEMIAEQDEAHCNALPAAMLPGMVEAQQLRDAAFADAALRLHEAGQRPVVLITGNGHARTDRGAPLYLRRASDVSVISVGLLEVDGDIDADVFDFVIHTATHDRGDPCEAFIKSRTE